MPTLGRRRRARRVDLVAGVLAERCCGRSRDPQRSHAPRRGEFGVTLDLPPGDEFGELGSFFNTVSQQLSADRSALAGQKANLQVAVRAPRGRVALFNPSGELLFSNPAMQATLKGDGIGSRSRAAARQPPGAHDHRGDAGVAPVARPVQASLEPRLECCCMTQMITGTDGELVGVLLVARNLAYMSRVQSMLAYSRKLVALGRLTAASPTR
jgi:hypothetical protein